MATQLGQLYYDLNIDDESFKAKIEAIRREIHGLDNEIISSVDGTNKLTSAWNETGKTIEQVKNQINVLKQVWDKLDFNDTAGHDALISRYKELSLVLDKNGASMDSLIQRQKEMERQMTKMSAFSMPENTIGDIRSKTNALTSERLGVSREQLGQYNKEIDRLNNLYKELSSVAKEAETPLRDLEEVLRMPSGNLNEIAQKISELKRVRGEQNQTDAQYIGNMTKIMEAESSLLSRQKEAMQIGVQRISAEQKINAELQRQPVSIEALIDSAKKLEAAYKSIDPNSALADQAKDRWMRLQQEIQKYGISIQSTAMQQRSFNQVMQMQASTGAQVLEKMRAINATRKQENINTDQGKKNISALNAEYIRLNNQLKDLGLKQLNFNERILSLGRIGNEVSGQLKQVFSLYTVERFIQRMIDVRSQFELQKTALRAILQDAGAAETIFAQVVELGLKSPFKTMEINSYVKQLAAYRIETESLFDTTKRLSDVSAGLGVDMGRLILAYGQVRAASVLRGQEVRQFTEAGIPLIEELADKFKAMGEEGITVADVFDKISKRLVPFQMVKEVFEDMTDMGGVFYNMQEIQSETLYGKVQNLGDAFDLMFNQLGEANDGVLKGTVDVLWKLADNWEYIAAAIKTAAAAYGVYKVAIISTTALSKILTIQNTLLARTFITLRNLSLATKFGLIAAGVVGIVTAFRQFSTIGKSTAEITSDLAEATEKYINGTKQIEKAINTYKELSDKTKLTANEQKRLSAITNELSKRVPGATQTIDGQTEALKNQHGVLDLSISKLREYVTLQNGMDKTEAENALKDAKDRLSKLQDERADLYKRQTVVAGGGAGEYIWRDAGSVTDADLTDAQKKRRDIIDADIAKTEQSIDQYEKSIEWKKVVAEELKSGWRKLAVEAAGGDKSLMPNNDEDLIAYADRLADMKKELKGKLHTTENVAGYGASDYKEQLRIIDEIVKSTKLRIDSEKSLSTEQRKVNKEEDDKAKKLIDSYRQELKFVDQVRKAYNDLRGEAEQFNDGTIEGSRLYEKQMAEIPKTLADIFKADEYTSILSGKLFEDDGYTDYLKSMIVKANETGIEAGESFAKEMQRSMADAEIESGDASSKLYLERLKKGYQLRNEWAGMEAPEGSGFTFRVSKIMTDAREEIRKLWKEYEYLSFEATEQDKENFKGIANAREAAVKEGANQKATKAGYAYVNEQMKRQKLDVDFSSLSETSFETLKRMRQALKDIQDDLLDVTEGKEGSFAELFKAAGGDFDNIKDHLDFSNIKTLSESISLLINSIPNLSQKQKEALTTILPIIKAIGDTTGTGINEINREMLKTVVESIDSVSDSFGLLSDAVKTYSEATNNELMNGLSTTLSAMSKVGKAVSNVGQSFLKNKTSGFLAIIKEIITSISNLMNAQAEYELREQEFIASKIAQQREYNLLLIEQIMLQKEGADGILYNNIVKSFQSGAIAAIKSQEEYNKAVLEGSELYDGQWETMRKNMSKTGLSGKVGFVEWAERSSFEASKGELTDLEKALSSVLVKTGTMKNKFLGITLSSKDVYTGLLQAYPKTLDAEGNLDVAFAKSILSTQKLDSVGRETLENLIAYTEEYNSAMENLDGIITDLFGEIGNLISSSLINAFKDGEFASDKFFESVKKGIGDMVDSLVLNMITSAVFGDMLDSYKEPIKNAMLSDDPQKNITDLMGQLVNDISTSSEAAASAVKIYSDARKEAGLGIVNENLNQGQLQTGLARASQESIDMMTGYLMSTQGMVSEIRNNSFALNMNITAQTHELKQQTYFLNSINRYSKEIRDFNMLLPEIRNAITNVDSKGVKIREI